MPMRRTLFPCRRGLAAAAAVVLLTACGGSDEEPPAASETTTATSSSTPESSAPAADSEFCTTATDVLRRVLASLTSQDQSTVPGVLQQAAEDVQTIQPPAEIADDWASFRDFSQQFAAISQIDFEDPAAYARWQAETAALQGQFAPAVTSVQTYLSTQCGLPDAGGTSGSAAPS